MRQLASRARYDESDCFLRYEGALFLEQTSKTLSEKGDVKMSTQLADEAAALYERALGGFMKKNMLLHFAFADYEESRLKYQKVHQVRFLSKIISYNCDVKLNFLTREASFVLRSTPLSRKLPISTRLLHTFST